MNPDPAFQKIGEGSVINGANPLRLYYMYRKGTVMGELKESQAQHNIFALVMCIL